MNKKQKKWYPSGKSIQKMLRSMRISLFMIMVSLLPLSAIAYSQTIDLNYKNASLESIMKSIRNQSEYSFLFDDVAVNEVKNIAIHVEDATIDQVMERCLEGTGISYKIKDKTIILFQSKQQGQPTFYTIKGKVVDMKGVALPSVTVRVDSTFIGTATNVDGEFAIKVNKSKGVLVFSFVGFKSVRMRYENGKPVLVKMEEDVASLDEVQVRAYGEQKKRTMISSISSVKSEDIKELPTHSLENLLQGHMAGVEVNNITGSPGGGGTIVAIRGYNSMFTKGEGDDRKYGTPLYVVDGVPIQAFTSPVTGTNTLSNIDPSMIESVEVLKDAASAAIYGSRAANGVILITTKKGRSGSAKFSANVSYSSSWLPETPTITGGNAERKFRLVCLRNSIAPYQNKDGEWVVPTSYEEVYKNKNGEKGAMYDWFWSGVIGSITDKSADVYQDSLNPFYNNSTDWWRKQYRVGKVINANLQASGGTDRMRYMVGAGYYKEDGIAVSTSYERVNVLSNLSIIPTSKISLDMQTSLSYTDRSRGPNSGNNGNKIETIVADPIYTSSLIYPEAEQYVLASFNSVDEKNHGYAARINGVLGIELYKGLKLSVSGSLDYNQQNQNVFYPSSLDKYMNLSKSTGNIQRSISLLNEDLLTYTKTIRENHNLDLLLGISFQKDQTYSNNGSGEGGPNDHIHYVGDGWGNSDGLTVIPNGQEGNYYRSAFYYRSDYEESKMNSVFGRLSYNYKERYMLEATIRRDGSSTFGENVRWATFPSFAAGWAFSQENFMKRFYWLSFAKIRGSWGTSGNMFHQNYLAHGLMSPLTNYSFLGKTGMGADSQGGIINRDLSWEKTDQYDLGLDISLFNYALELKADYYYRYTSDLLSEVELPGDVLNMSTQWRNTAAISNEGIEFEVTANLFTKTKVKWRSRFNISRNWNRFEKSYDGMDLNNYVIGKPLYQIKVYKTDGYYSSFDEVPVYYTANGEKQPLHTTGKEEVFFEGARKIIDLNGDGVINYEDMYYAKSPIPLAHGGWANEVKWKNFDLSVMFTYSLGRHAVKIYDDMHLAPIASGGPIYGDLSKMTYWSSTNTKADYPVPLNYVNTAQYTGYYDCDIEKVNMVRLKQLTLGYNVSENFGKKIGINSARIFITAENLFLLTNYSGLDPELIDITNGSDNLRSYPLPRKFTVGLTVNF